LFEAIGDGQAERGALFLAKLTQRTLYRLMLKVLEPTPTAHTPVEPLRFQNLTQALDAASVELSGMNFHAGRGELVEAFSYRELAEQARLVGAKLLAKGLVKGDRVGLIAETEGDFVRAFMGCLYAHLIPAPLPLPVAFGARGAYGEHLHRILNVADVAAIIVPEGYLSLISESLAVLSSTRDLRFVGPVGGLDDETAPLPEHEPEGDELAYLQFSSGTTRTPKGIAVSHRAMMANIHGMAVDALQIHGNDRGMSWLPFYHDMGLVGCMLLPIACHISIDYLATRDFIRRPALWTAMISRAGATLSYAPTFGYELAARRKSTQDNLDLSSWRIAGIGGDMIKPEGLRAFVNVYAPFGFRKTSFLPSYGMAEVSLGVTFEKLESGLRVDRLDLGALEEGRAVSALAGETNARDFALCGRVLPDHLVEVRDENNQVVGERTIGTVFIKGPSIMQGYFRDPAETARALDDAGWLNTGDLGYLTDGNLVLTGRIKDLMIVNGRNIWPQDIEWTLEKGIPEVRQGRVVAFDAQGAVAGDQNDIIVVAECRLNQAGEREALRARIDTLVRTTFGVTAKVALSPAGLLPRTSSGKLSRSKARLMYIEGAFGG